MAILTNGGDRLYGGPYFLISCSLGKEVGWIGTSLLFIANISYVVMNCSLIGETVTRFVHSVPHFTPEFIANCMNGVSNEFHLFNNL
ncbi:hypothetical protein AB6A40_011579 [Gnathostoma spinigerum]|uniref:Amino acid transporter transmembrane domain-containing protein n=1 Tax=Gnathostoma spinigerum TaxID=75299 RepID=A0ABD6F4T8_9BILA